LKHFPRSSQSPVRPGQPSSRTNRSPVPPFLPGTPSAGSCSTNSAQPSGDCCGAHDSPLLAPSKNLYTLLRCNADSLDRQARNSPGSGGEHGLAALLASFSLPPEQALNLLFEPGLLCLGPVQLLLDPLDLGPTGAKLKNFLGSLITRLSRWRHPVWTWTPSCYSCLTYMSITPPQETMPGLGMASDDYDAEPAGTCFAATPTSDARCRRSRTVG